MTKEKVGCPGKIENRGWFEKMMIKHCFERVARMTKPIKGVIVGLIGFIILGVYFV